MFLVFKIFMFSYIGNFLKAIKAILLPFLPYCMICVDSNKIHFFEISATIVPNVILVQTLQGVPTYDYAKYSKKIDCTKLRKNWTIVGALCIPLDLPLAMTSSQCLLFLSF